MELGGTPRNVRIENGRAYGQLYDDVLKRWEDGEHIVTSTIQLIVTKNTIYKIEGEIK